MFKRKFKFNKKELGLDNFNIKDSNGNIITIEEYICNFYKGKDISNGSLLMTLNPYKEYSVEELIDRVNRHREVNNINSLINKKNDYKILFLDKSFLLFNNKVIINKIS